MHLPLTKHLFRDTVSLTSESGHSFTNSCITMNRTFPLDNILRWMSFEIWLHFMSDAFLRSVNKCPVWKRNLESLFLNVRPYDTAGSLLFCNIGLIYRGVSNKSCVYSVEEYSV